MKPILSLLACACIASLPTFHAGAQSVEACQAAAEQNYPLIKQYGLIEKTAALSIENIGKNWLPQITASGQATWQSDVVSWPEGMSTLMQQAGLQLKGLKKDQYRIGIDIQQTLYDGGSIDLQKNVARLTADIETAETSINLYEVRRRCNEMYFALLLLDEQIRLCRDREALLLANEEKLEKLFRGGVAAECDWKAMRAERLAATAKLCDLSTSRNTLKRTLEVFCGIENLSPELPSDDSSFVGDSVSTSHPQMRLFASRLALTDANERSLNAPLRPRLSLFASGYYGYPGYNMFEDMMRHRWTLNAMIGARLTWNISGLYTRKADKARLATQRQQINTARETFLFNTHLDVQRQNDDAQRYRTLLQQDDEIISLREDVRRAAESKLSHGLIDAAQLVRDINEESAARIGRSQHQIEMWKTIYDKKLTTNN